MFVVMIVKMITDIIRKVRIQKKKGDIIDLCLRDSDTTVLRPRSLTQDKSLFYHQTLQKYTSFPII